MFLNQNIHSNYLATQQSYTSNDLQQALPPAKPNPDTNPDDPDSGEVVEKVHIWDLPKEEQRIYLAPIYTFYREDLCRRFSVNAVIEAYDYTFTVADLTHTRNYKITYCELLQDEHPAASQLFGMELARMSWGGMNYDVENDFHGVYYLFGAVGLGLMIAFIAYFWILILWALKKNAKRYFTPAAGAFGISLCIALVNAYFTAGVLRRPNSSFYLSILLAVIFYLVCIQKYDDEGTLATKAVKKLWHRKRGESAQ